VVKVNEPTNDIVTDSSSSQDERLIEIPQTISVRHLAELLLVSAIAIIKQLMRSGIIANINQVIDYEKAATVATAFGYEVRLKTRKLSEGGGKRHQLQDDELSGLLPRPPVVTIMGHVNHGKTRLLDAIRQTNVMASEAGGITQHIGAYQVDVDGQKITFLDTPGHEAFTAMRARGAQATDVTILVVAADDGVMPQTLEAIDHARAAGVPILVALNKIDKANANPDMVKQQLADAGLLIEEWGGDVICVPISAKDKKGIHELLENLLLVAEMEDIVANPSQPAKGIVIEAGLDKTKGPLATVLVQAGTLRISDNVVIGTTWGRVKAMFNDIGKRVRKAEPATPVQILGLESVPHVGDMLIAVSGEHHARALIQKHQSEMDAESSLVPKPVSLSNLFDQINVGRVKELNIILKVDVQGSIDPIRSSLQPLGIDDVQVRVIHSGTGNITESDVMLAIASKGLIVGFNTGSETGARRLADIEGVSIRNYDVIYNLIDDINKALKGMLEPTYVEIIDGRAEIREVFASGKKEKVAGVIMSEGKVTIGVPARIWRGEHMVYESAVSSLRRFKDEVKEVTNGYECGVGIKDYDSFEIGDILEFYRREKRV
jgi:translation initiation factor IF-2